ncbi:MAG TPA: glycosyltransferase family 4 protein [Aquihabitans sp.]|nr:glycosyltransferase family 4 protein [Aquihabitans sp.]
MRVLAVIESLGQGGAEHSLVAVAPLLAGHGVDLEVLCGEVRDDDLRDALVAAGVPVHAAGTTGLRAMCSAVRARIASGSYELVHATLFVPVVASGVAAVGTRVPVLASLVNTAAVAARLDPRVPGWKLRAAHVVETASLHLLVDRVHAVTPGVARSARRHHLLPTGKVAVVERGRDGARFRAASPAERIAVRHELAVPEGVPLLLAVGRHEHQKGYDVLLDAFGRHQRSGGQGVLVVAGRTGTATADIEAEVARLPDPSRVRIVGNRADMPALYGAADLFVLSSWREGAAGAAVEAMACRVPMVVTDVDGLRGVVADDVSALVVPRGDAVAMAGAVRRLLDDAPTRARLAAAAAEVFEARFTLDRAAAGLAALYLDVGGRRRPARRAIARTVRRA